MTRKQGHNIEKQGNRYRNVINIIIVKKKETSQSLWMMLSVWLEYLDQPRFFGWKGDKKDRTPYVHLFNDYYAIIYDGKS